MLELIILIVLAGCAIAGVWDLKTTEVPDDVPALMIMAGISFWFFIAVSRSDFLPLYYSLIIGTISLFIGLLLYHTKQWGEADAWLLAAIGYGIPLLNNEIFFISFIPNMLIVSVAYMIIYSIAVGLKNRKTLHYYKKDLSENKYIILIPLLAFIMLSALYFMFPNPDPSPIIWMFLLITAFTFFWRYAKVVEKFLFKKIISVKELRTGDVLVNMKWVGLTNEEVKKIQKTQKTVTIKEGVRFVPVFFLSLLFTLIYGNLMLILL